MQSPRHLDRADERVQGEGLKGEVGILFASVGGVTKHMLRAWR